ncbi:hypothetical protein BGAFAR04_0082 [Borreliella garinii Far04]|nr:hypothetical protein BGAFAR04_0082 [Borreliella garinii Far04]
MPFLKTLDFTLLLISTFLEIVLFKSIFNIIESAFFTFLLIE